MSQPACTVRGCKRPHKSRGYCAPHYRQYIFLPTHQLYNIWSSMIQRCTNPKNQKYADYGGRGIRVCERWQRSYRAFAVDVGLRPGPQYSIDRINNNGDYEPGNVQWSTPIMQSMNRRIRKTNSSGVTGVYWHEGFQKWHATITINKRRHHLGLFKTLPEAAEARYLAEARYTV